jgi:hypothetical protein
MIWEILGAGPLHPLGNVGRKRVTKFFKFLLKNLNIFEFEARPNRPSSPLLTGCDCQCGMQNSHSKLLLHNMGTPARRMASHLKMLVLVSFPHGVRLCL